MPSVTFLPSGGHSVSLSGDSRKIVDATYDGRVYVGFAVLT